MKSYKQFVEESYYKRPIEGGTGKGKKFGAKGTTVDHHLSAMKYHLDKHHESKKSNDDAGALHHGEMYHAHKEQIDRLGDIGNPYKN